MCSCFSVGVNTLRDSIVARGLATPEAIGELLGAGTNCGSCVPELRRLIAEAGTESDRQRAVQATAAPAAVAD